MFRLVVPFLLCIFCSSSVYAQTQGNPVNNLSVGSYGLAGSLIQDGYKIDQIIDMIGTTQEWLCSEEALTLSGSLAAEYRDILSKLIEDLLAAAEEHNNEDSVYVSLKIKSQAFEYTSCWK